MKINTLRLENFQGIKAATFDFKGQSASVYGDNATGKGYVETLSPEVCLKAINKAIDGGAEKQNWNYIRGILRNLAKQKVRSVADWDRLEAERERRKNGANRKGPGPDHGQNTGPPGAEGAGAGIGGFHPAESADE